ncbi:MAG: RNase adapter RapZ [Sphingosinicella sp.]
MAAKTDPKRIVLVTGLSGAGKSTALKTLEDLGWEVVDNLPLSLLDPLLASPNAPGAERRRPLALGLDCRTRGFDADHVVRQAGRLGKERDTPIEILFLECQTGELVRRYSESRRRHPLAPDRPASDGIKEERDLVGPLRRWADHVIDTTDSDAHGLQQQIRERFHAENPLTVSLISFGYSQGLPRDADLVFDMRFLRNPHWQKELRDLSGLDQAVCDHIAADESYVPALEQIERLLIRLVPRYAAEGKSYLSIAFGCTGGRHRSVHVAERVAERLRKEGFSPTLHHRDLVAPPPEGTERPAGAKRTRRTASSR